MAKTKAALSSKAGLTNEKFIKVRELFEEIRDLLFDCSREVTKGDGPNWQKAEAFFRLAKHTDALRLSMISLIEDEQSELEIANSPLLEVVEHPSQFDEAKISASFASKNTRKKKGDYPKYSIRGDLLIKTGLSRDRKSEYEHSVPQKVFNEIVKRVVELSKTKKNFTADDIQSVLDCPSYQTYIVLSFFKSRGLLVIPSRGFYGFKAAKTFAEDAVMTLNGLKSL